MSTGQPISRIEGPDKVTGRAAYTADQNPPGVLHGVLVGSPVASGRLRAIDSTDALRVPGVLRVLTRADMPAFGAIKPPAAVLCLPLQTDIIEYEDEAVAIVVAETLEAAEEGARVVRVTVDATPPVLPGKGKLMEAPGEAGLGAPVRRGCAGGSASQG